jgi:hypothetical protein
LVGKFWGKNMKPEEILKLSYEEFNNYMTGLALMELGRGNSLKNVVYLIMHWTLFWKEKT